MGTTDPFDASEMKKELLSMLECPVCFETMEKPIFVCVNGHNICERCKSKVNICPSCRDVFSNTRNFFAEKASEKFLASCKYSSNGCRVKLMPGKIAKHESQCSHKTIECLIGEGVDSIEKCGWKGKKADLLAHSRGTPEHKGKVWKRYPIEGPVYCMNFESNYVEVDLIPRDGELFWLFIKYDATEKKYYEAVQLIGSPDEASMYKYTHEIGSIEEEQVITYVNVTRSAYEDIETIFKSGKCLVLDHSVFINHCRQCLFETERGTELCIKLPGYTLTITKTC